MNPVVAPVETQLGSTPSTESLQTVGLEEELILIDPCSFEPTGRIEDVIRLLDGDRRFAAEFRAAQIELVTAPCLAVADACRELASVRQHLVSTLDGSARVLAAGTHPTSIAPIELSTRPRYVEIAFEDPWATQRGLPSGLHVHVGVGTGADALAVYNAARSYLPELAALAANSPYFEGRDTGLASSRLRLTEDFPRSGIPPAFASWAEFAAFQSWGRRSGSFRDLTYLWWDLRLRPDYGTLEFRVADAQTTVDRSAAIAALCQSLVAMLLCRVRRGEPLPVHASHVVHENRWRALRDGLDGELADLDTGRPAPTRERIGRLLLELEPYAAELGCAEELGCAWEMLARNGADEQRALVEEHGIGELPRRLAERTEAGYALGASTSMASTQVSGSV